MRTALILLVSVSFVVATPAAVASTPRVLDLDQRVSALEALERVRSRHRTAGRSEATPSLATLEGRVRTTLQQSLALERIWSERVTAAALGRELERMRRGTRMPQRLQEYIDALGRDPVLVQECLVRPVLVERLVHARFAWDARIHAAVRESAAALRARLLLGERVATPEPAKVELLLDPGDGPPPPPAVRDVPQRRLDAAAFDAIRASFEHGVSPLRETAEAFFVDVLVEDEPARMLLWRWAVPKRSWPDWWSEVSPLLAPLPAGMVATEAIDAGALELDRSVCLPDDVWNNGSLGDVPEERAEHGAVWTGTEMLVWGGTTLWGEYVTTGRRYDPALDAWSAMTSAGAPVPRRLHHAVWSGTHMIVWGGQDALTLFKDGGRYDPQLDQWLPMSSVSGPSARTDPTVVWTGAQMIVWGGVSGSTRLQTGARYDPLSDSWSPTSLVGAPTGRRLHTAVWSGSEMVVWGGEVPGSFAPTSTNEGGRYDPVADQWRNTRTQSAPIARTEHVAVWTGSEMIVWGGRSSSSSWLTDGARYDPARDRWIAMTASGAPSARLRSRAVWTGSEMLVWGGRLLNGSFDGTGARYRPATDAWTPVSIVGAPSGREAHTAVWTGSRMVVFGGLPGPVVTGGSYDPVDDVWIATSTGNAATARQSHTAVWTGAEMIVWGGWNNLYLSSGERYDPALDAWTPIASTGAPSGRVAHTTVWTGSQMIVWGGFPSTIPIGARYDPATDQWSPVAVQDAAEARYDHVAVWADTHLLVWGGRRLSDGTYLQNGGRYDPVTDSWRSMSLSAAPSARWASTAVWTGIEMIVWGGLGNGYEHTGARYDPRLDRWHVTNGLNAPVGRASHTALWTGDEMIVWGGHDNGVYLNDGRRYDPKLDTWSNMPDSGISGRSDHTVVWTGRDMIIWDGQTPAASDGTGGRYDAVTLQWEPVSTVDAPSGRDLHTAVWTGAEMIVWAGDGGATILRTGGRYSADSDSDGVSDGCDNCIADENPSQGDGDTDGFGDACDLCPAMVDTFQGDIDGDGVGDTCDPDRDGDGAPNETDCAPEHPGAHTPVGEIDVLVVDRADSVFLNWPAQGSGVTYDLIGGLLSDLRTSGLVTAAECLAAALETPRWDDTREGPPLDDGWYYLVRGVNACGPGTFGSATDGTEHLNAACP